ncbi:MAG: redoxin domain-containing protein [bacterium]|nr:redoxin domain-containing protein [bacterium]
MNEKYSSKGLSIVALTSESESKTEPWVAAKGAKYAYAYDKGGKMKRALGVRGIPSAILVDPSGKIIWEGHPSSVTEELVEKAIEGAISTPVYEWDKSTKAVKKAFLNGDFGKAIKAADKLAEQNDLGKEIGQMLRGMVAKRVGVIEADLKAGEVFKAYSAAEAMAKKLKGLPEATTLKTIIEQVSKDKSQKKILKTQGKLADLLSEERTKRKEADKIIKGMEGLLKGNDDEYTAEKIKKAIKDLKNERRKMER